MIEKLSVDPRKLPMYDQALLGILQSEGKIDTFLDTVFSFLYRKTDFFRFLTKESEQNMGFPPGVANKMVEHYFTKYLKLSVSAYEESIKAQKNKETISDSKTTTEPQEPPKPVPSVEPAQVIPTELESSSEQTFNGSSGDNYKWSQNYDEVDVTVPVPEVASARDLKIEIKARPKPSLRITTKQGKTLIDSELKGD